LSGDGRNGTSSTNTTTNALPGKANLGNTDAGTNTTKQDPAADTSADDTPSSPVDVIVGVCTFIVIALAALLLLLYKRKEKEAAEVAIAHRRAAAMNKENPAYGRGEEDGANAEYGDPAAIHNVARGAVGVDGYRIDATNPPHAAGGTTMQVDNPAYHFGESAGGAVRGGDADYVDPASMHGAGAGAAGGTPQPTTQSSAPVRVVQVYGAGGDATYNAAGGSGAGYAAADGSWAGYDDVTTSNYRTMSVSVRNPSGDGTETTYAIPLEDSPPDAGGYGILEGSVYSGGSSIYNGGSSVYNGAASIAGGSNTAVYEEASTSTSTSADANGYSHIPTSDEAKLRRLASTSDYAVAAPHLKAENGNENANMEDTTATYIGEVAADSDVAHTGSPPSTQDRGSRSGSYVSALNVTTSDGYEIAQVSKQGGDGAAGQGREQGMAGTVGATGKPHSYVNANKALESATDAGQRHGAEGDVGGGGAGATHRYVNVVDAPASDATAVAAAARKPTKREKMNARVAAAAAAEEEEVAAANAAAPASSIDRHRASSTCDGFCATKGGGGGGGNIARAGRQQSKYLGFGEEEEV
jgi:hypothetical protein